MEVHMFCDEDDATLCEKACSGCEQAFTALFHRHYHAVHAFAFRACLDVGGAEDITQEAFIKEARSLPSFRRQASFKWWLYRIAMNATHDWCRKKIGKNKPLLNWHLPPVRASPNMSQISNRCGRRSHHFPRRCATLLS